MSEPFDYQKPEWVNVPEGETPPGDAPALDADALDDIGTAIDSLETRVGAIEESGGGDGTPADGSVTNAKVAVDAAISTDKTADGTTTKAFLATERTKLAGIASGATAYTDEQARDAIAAALVGGTNITITPNDGADTITVAVSGLTVIDAGWYGIVPDGNHTAQTGTDNTTALRAAVAAAKTARKPLYIPPGTYRVTAPIPVPSGITIYGDGPAAVLLFSTTAGQPVIASETWLTAFDGTPVGYSALRGLSVAAEGVNAASHGIVWRDYYATIEDVAVYRCGGDGIRLAEQNQAGTATGLTLVENHYRNLLIDGCKGWGFRQEVTAARFTDAFMSELVVVGSASSAGGAYIPYSAGWQVRQVHIYGDFTGAALVMGRMWGSILDGAQIERGWTGAAVQIASFQREGIIDNVHVAMSEAGGTALEMTKSGLYPGAGPVVGAVSVVADYPDTPGTVLTWDNNTVPVLVSSLMLSGENVEDIALVGGFGASRVQVASEAAKARPGVGTRIRAGATGQSFANGAVTEVDFNIIEYCDDTSLYVIDLTDNSITVAEAGNYLVQWELKFTGGTAGARYAALGVNGGTVRETGFTGGPAAQATSGASPLRLAAGSVVNLSAYVDGGTAVSVVSGQSYETGLSLVRLGA